MNLFALWKKFSNQGIAPDMIPIEKKRIRLLNQVSLIFIIVESFIIPTTFIDWSLPAIYTYLIWLASILVIYLQHQKKFALARLIFLFDGN